MEEWGRRTEMYGDKIMIMLKVREEGNKEEGLRKVDMEMKEKWREEE